MSRALAPASASARQAERKGPPRLPAPGATDRPAPDARGHRTAKMHGVQIGGSGICEVRLPDVGVATRFDVLAVNGQSAGWPAAYWWPPSGSRAALTSSRPWPGRRCAPSAGQRGQQRHRVAARDHLQRARDEGQLPHADACRPPWVSRSTTPARSTPRHRCAKHRLSRSARRVVKSWSSP